jgi:hypothetical protein
MEAHGVDKLSRAELERFVRIRISSATGISRDR